MRQSFIGLALGGGAVLGGAHIGILRAIEEAGLEVKAISGTSIGAFVATLYAFGKNWQDIQSIVADLDWLDISRFSLSSYGLLSNERLGELLNEHLGDVEINEAHIPLAVIATDISRGEKVILNKGDAAQAVMASTAIPGIFRPVEINNRLLIDGGIMENVPITPLEQMGANFIIAADLTSNRRYEKPDGLIDLLISSIDLALGNITKFYNKRASLIIAPELSNYNYTDTDQLQDLINEGYRCAVQILKSAS